jgi:hypothetical protein
MLSIECRFVYLKPEVFKNQNQTYGFNELESTLSSEVQSKPDLPENLRF